MRHCSRCEVIGAVEGDVAQRGEPWLDPVGPLHPVDSLGQAGGQLSAPSPSERRAMTQRTAADLRDALLATRDLASARAARRAVTRPAAPLPTSTDHRRFERAVSAALAKGGVDAEEWGSEVARARAVDRRRAEALKADAVQHSGARARQLAEGIEGQRKALDLLSNMTNAPAPAQYDALDSPFLVWGSTGLSVLSSTIEPWSSRAKFTFEASLGPSSAHIESVGTEQLSFFFLWENPGDGYALVTVDGYLVLNGYCQAEADGGLFGGNLTTLDVDANLDLHGLPTPPLAQDGQYLPVARLRGDATDWFSDDVTVPQVVYRGFDLRHELLPVPPGGVVVEVSVSLSFDYGIGAVSADFATGEFEVGCPFVQILVLAS